MRLNGLSAHTCRKGPFRSSLIALAAALALSGCLDTSLTSKPEPAPVVEALPAPVIDQTIYAARQDGKFTLPAIDAAKIPEQYRRQVVDYPTSLPAGTIVIDPTPKFLYYVLGDGKAVRYGISVGAEGFQWSGESIVANKRQWPTWTPPAEMIARKPSLEKWKNGQPGGPTNPLGARAIYLTTNGVDYGYRIHGTPEWRSIGKNASSGCFRMINQDVLDLYERVKGGERVIVLTKDGQMPTKLSIPTPPKPKAPKVEPKPEVAATPESATATTTPASPAVIAPVPQQIGVPPALGGSTPAAVAPASTPAATPAAPTPAAPGVSPAAPAAPADATMSNETPLSAPPTVSGFAPTAPLATGSTPAPVATPASPSCAVPLANGNCPAN